MRGAGWGHGIGMSQWGAYGYAQHGANHREILSHYYRDTQIGSAPAGAVRVLLQANRPVIYFRHATLAGDHTLVEDSGYRATREGDNVVLRSSSGRRLASFPEVMRVVGGKHVRLMGRAQNGVRDGLYRDHIEIRTASGSGPQRDQRRRPGRLPAGRRPERESSGVARRGARGPGRRRAIVRAGLERERQGLRPVRRHAQSGVPRLSGRDARDERSCRRNGERSRHLQRRDRHDLLSSPRRAATPRTSRTSSAAALRSHG